LLKRQNTKKKKKKKKKKKQNKTQEDEKSTRKNAGPLNTGFNGTGFGKLNELGRK
jgi:hypothetical protein